MYDAIWTVALVDEDVTADTQLRDGALFVELLAEPFSVHMIQVQ